MKGAIYGRLLKNNDIQALQYFITLLEKSGVALLIHEGYYAHLVNRIQFTSVVEVYKNHKDLIKKKADFMFSIGGDGTLLDVVTLIRDSNIPIVGINTGRLGFLANIGKDNIDKAVNEIVGGVFKVDKRALIRLESTEPIFGETNYALNEFAIYKRDASSLIVIHTYINGEYLNSYWADGLIVATPTGSTAYSLSCGGPIIFPKSESFVITPVAPHNLNMRPIVVSDDCIISFEVEGRNDSFICTLDSRIATIDSNIQLAVTKEKFGINLIRMHDDDFLHTLRNKMMWGVDKRN